MCRPWTITPSGAAVVAWLRGLKPQVDFDGNGTAEAVPFQKTDCQLPLIANC